MEKTIKLLALSIIIAAAIVSISICFSALSNRYTFIKTSESPYNITFDKLTGNYYFPSTGDKKTVKRNDIKNRVVQIDRK